MSDPIFSPDGQFMWTGSEWIPAPPTSSQSADSNINLQDSMMSGDVNVEQNSNDASSAINIRDSAMSGDINITQNNLDDIVHAMSETLNKFGFVNDGIEQKVVNLTSADKQQLEEALDISEELDKEGFVNEPWVEFNLGKAAYAVGRRESGLKHYTKAVELFRKKNDIEGIVHSLQKQAWALAQTAGRYFEAENKLNQALELSKSLHSRLLESEIHLTYALVYLCTEDFDKGIESVNKSIELLENKQLLALNEKTMLGVLKMHGGHHSEGIEILEEVVRSATERNRLDCKINALNFLAEAKRSAGWVHDAIEMYEEILDFHNDNDEIYHQYITLKKLGSCKKSIGDNLQAEQYLDSCLEIITQNSEEFTQKHEAEVLFELCVIANSLGNYERAQLLAEKCIAIDDGSEMKDRIPELLFILGNTSEAKNEFIDADRYYQKSLFFARKSKDKAIEEQLLFRIGRVAKKQGDFPKANKYFQEFFDHEL